LPLVGPPLDVPEELEEPVEPDEELPAEALLELPLLEGPLTAKPLPAQAW